MFFLSWRQLASRKKQTFLILLGISFGTMLFVSISGVQLGMRAYVAEQLLNNTAHILVSGAERTVDPVEVTEAFYGPEPRVRWITPPSGKREVVQLENYSGWYERLTHDPRVFDFSPRLTINAMLSNGNFTASVGLIGTIPDKQLRISSIQKYMEVGKFSDLKSGRNQIVLGSGAADELGTRIGQYINVGTGRVGETARSFKVVGIVHFGNEQIDKKIAFAELTDVQVLTQSPGRVSDIAVALYEIERAPEIAAQWRMASSEKVQDWQQANKMFMEMINVQDFTRYFIVSSILIVAAFGVYNVLTIMINQKQREIAILRAIGYGPDKVLQLILYQGLLLGAAGGALGLTLGFLLCVWIGSVDFGFEIGGSNHLWISYDWTIYASAFVSANVASFFASYLPAHSAKRMTPMEILRSE